MNKIGNATLMQVQDGIIWDFSGCPKLFYIEEFFLETQGAWEALEDSCPEEIAIVSYDIKNCRYIVQRLGKKLGTELLMEAQEK